MMFVAGISFKTAPVALREQLAVIPSRLTETATRLKEQGGLSELVLLSTCNRVELYGVADQAGRLVELLGSLARTPLDVSPYVYIHVEEAAARHLFAVASGLDSMVLGETEITGQIKTAYEAARAAKLTGRVINGLFQRAFQVVKAVRTRTQIGRGATSVGSVAVQLAEKIFGERFSRQDRHDHRGGQNGRSLHPAHRQKGRPLHHRSQPHPGTRRGTGPRGRRACR